MKNRNFFQNDNMGGATTEKKMKTSLYREAN
jgi:hypothetical protein